MKNLLLTVILLCFCLPFVKAADQKMILISTNETDLILQVAPNPWMGSVSLFRSGGLFRTGFRHPAQRREHDQYIQVCFQRIRETRQ